MSGWTLALGLAAACQVTADGEACADDPDCLGSEDGTAVDSCPSSEPEAPETVDCGRAGSVVTITVAGSGSNKEGQLFLVDTQNVYGGATWTENHPLRTASRALEGCGDWFTVAVELETGATPEDSIPGKTTVFGCADQFDRGDGLTYAAKVGRSCVVWGHDPLGLLDGHEYDEGRMSDPPAFSFGGCDVVEP